MQEIINIDTKINHKKAHVVTESINYLMKQLLYNNTVTIFKNYFFIVFLMKKKYFFLSYS